MGKVSARSQLEAEEEESAGLATRLENLATALDQAGEKEAARLVKDTINLQWDVYEKLHEALDVFPQP